MLTNMLKTDSKLTFNYIYFLNHANLSKNEENIGPLYPPPKTAKMEGGSDTVDCLYFGYVSRFKDFRREMLTF